MYIPCQYLPHGNAINIVIHRLLSHQENHSNNGDYRKLDSQNKLNLALLSGIEVILSLNIFRIPDKLHHIIRIVRPNV